MGVLCFSSLKGGVGKTSLAINTAAAFAARGGETLLIDLDPTAHTTRFFLKPKPLSEAPLPRLFLNAPTENGQSLVEYSLKNKINLLREVRERLVLLPSGPEIRHCSWGKGANQFKCHFSNLIRELRLSFDYIIIDTPPDFSVTVRNAIAASDLLIVPVDGSAMSIDCLNQLVLDAGHIVGPQWAIVRSMVSKRASTLHRLSNDRMREQVSVKHFSPDTDVDDDDVDSDETLKEFEAQAANDPIGPGVYLLDSVIHRTEEQNKLTFSGKTSFEVRKCGKLSNEYSKLARELDALLIISEENKSILNEDSSSSAFDLGSSLSDREFADCR